MAETVKLAPLFAKLAEAAQEISDVFASAGGMTLGKRGPGELDEKVNQLMSTFRLII